MVMSGLHYMVVGEKWVWLCLVYTIWYWEKSGCGYVCFTLGGIGRKVGMDKSDFMIVGENWKWLCLVYTIWEWEKSGYG